MKGLGEYLRSERLNRGISLEDISRETRISMRMLQAIEDGSTESLPAAVLVKGFLRTYAQKIGLDPETVMLRYQDLYEEEGARREALEKFHERFRPVPTRRRLLIPGGAAALVICLVLAWLFFPRDRHQTVPPSTETPTVVPVPQEAAPAVSAAPTDPTTVRSSLPPVQSALPAVPAPMRETLFPSEPSSIGGSEPAPAASPGDQGAPTLKPSPQAPPVLPPRTEVETPAQAPLARQSLPSQYVLKAEVVETTWLRVSVDEGREVEYLLQAGEQMKWQAKSGLTLLVGNAAGVRLFLNDKPLKALGQKGQVVGVSLPDDSLLQTTAPSSGPSSP